MKSYWHYPESALKPSVLHTNSSMFISVGLDLILADSKESQAYIRVRNFRATFLICTMFGCFRD